MLALNLDVEITRGDTVESRHRVHAAVIGADDVLIGAARDSALVTMWRSCAKPFQLLPLLASGGASDAVASVPVGDGGRLAHQDRGARQREAGGILDPAADLTLGGRQPGSRQQEAGGGEQPNSHDF